MPYSTENGLKIYYDLCGNGPPMVLVHANPYDRRLWMYQIARFSQHFTVASVDIRGYGFSDKPETPFTLEDMADDVLGVCKREGITRAIFGGVSVGSGIALVIGLDHPEIADALVLVGGNSRGGGSIQKRIDGYTSDDLAGYRRAHMCELFAPTFPDTPLGRWTVNLFCENSDTLSGRSIAQIFRAREGCDMSGRLSGMTVPTLVINGEYDGSLKAGQATAAGIPGARHVVIPATGHACCIEDPGRFDEAMIGFIKDKGLWPQT
jgi:pimeloyl-ACP methyl ester carboxylesterase